MSCKKGLLANLSQCMAGHEMLNEFISAVQQNTLYNSLVDPVYLYHSLRIRDKSGFQYDCRKTKTKVITLANHS